MRGLVVWLLALLTWNAIIWIGRAFGVHATFGELLVIGLAGMLTAFVIVAGDRS